LVSDDARENSEKETVLDRLEANLKDGTISRADVFKRLRKASESSDRTTSDDTIPEPVGGLGDYSTFLRLLLVGGLLMR
jgi:hypothetical protein